MRPFLIAGVVLAGVSTALAQPTPPTDTEPVTPVTVTPTPVVTTPTPVPPVVATPAPAPPLLTGPARIPNEDRAIAERLCAEHDPSCDWMALLGSLERASIWRVLAERGYEIESAPWNKVIGAIHIYNEDVFAEKNRYLRFFNNFHYTTRESVIAKELVIGEGEVWDQARVEETARRLRDPLWTSVVAVIPVKSKGSRGSTRESYDPTKVDLLVVTRDVWSLRLNTKYAFSADEMGKKLTALNISLSENNFLGRRSVLAAGMTMDQGAIATGPIFIDKNLFGEHIDLRLRADAIFNRDRLLKDGVFKREGSDSSIAISRPLWSLAREWGAGVSFSHNYEISRSYLGTQLRTYCPIAGVPCAQLATPEAETFPYIYRSKVVSANAFVTRQWGGAKLKQQVSLGYTATSLRATPYGFEGTPEQEAAFIRDVLPRSEVSSGPYIEYAGYQPLYKTLRNLQTYDLGEDARFGGDYSVVLGLGAKVLGSDANNLRASASVGWTLRLFRDGFVRASAGIALHRQTTDADGNRIDPDHKYIDNTASGKIRLASPSTRYGRIIAETSLATRWNDTQNRFYTIGSETGLRGFQIDQFGGQRVFSTQIEARSTPYPLWVFRVGGVAFYDIGGAANALSHMPLHHDIGVGLRTLVPQTSRELFRFDFAVPLDGAAAGKLRFMAGFESAF